MTDDKITMLYDLRQDNTSNRSSFGKWYPRQVHTTTLGLDGLADYIHLHGSVYTRDIVHGMVMKLRDSIVELLEQGVSVKLEGLGTFYTTLEADGADSPDDYDVRRNLRGVHIRLLPEKRSYGRLTSQAFAERVVMRRRLTIDRHGRLAGGHQVLEVFARTRAA